ncbi:membrane protein of unknown function [mine drainage metagenome]|uniref:Phage holin family protein n=1 Tax=mine drainage metagenome TaxID=410659 RepID=A0A1J5SZL5_9ZZZZ
MVAAHMNPSFRNLLLRWVVLGIGVALATHLIPGLSCDGAVPLLVVVILLSFFNAVIRPLLMLFALPFIVMTLGIGVFLINALLFMLVGRLVDGFHVASFGSALGGSLVVSATNFLLSAFRRPPPPPRRRGPPPPSQAGGGDVIDI